jgi:hypothetical protein
MFLDPVTGYPRRKGNRRLSKSLHQRLQREGHMGQGKDGHRQGSFRNAP